MAFDQPLAHILIGIFLIMMGRQLFWLFVGLVGFLGGFEFAQYIWTGPTQTMFLIGGIFFGLLGIGLALLFQKVAIIFAGIMAGGYLGLSFAVNVIGTQVNAAGIFMLLGALAGGVLMVAFFDIMLIVLSSSVGAMVLMEPFHPDGYRYPLILSVLVIFGIVFQSFLSKPEQPIHAQK
jgi:hypothetical protein